MIAICLLIMFLWFIGQPINWLVDKLCDVDWRKITHDAWNKIVLYSKRAGRSATRMALYFYYSLSEGRLTTGEKALLYGGIIYIIIPNDLLPRRILKFIGIIDDVAIIAWVYNKVRDTITPEIESKVGETLDKWFGYEITNSVTI